MGALPQVEAVTLAGARAAHAADEKSDFDLYVYITAEIPLEIRKSLAESYAKHFDIIFAVNR